MESYLWANWFIVLVNSDMCRHVTEIDPIWLFSLLSLSRQKKSNLQLFVWEQRVRKYGIAIPSSFYSSIFLNENLQETYKILHGLVIIRSTTKHLKGHRSVDGSVRLFIGF